MTAQVIGTQTYGYSEVSPGVPGAALVMRCALPADAVVGEKLRLYVALNSGSLAACPSGWSPVGLQSSASAMVEAYERVVDGTEGDHVDVQLHATAPKTGAYVCERIEGWDTAAVNALAPRAQGQNTAPNPSSVSPGFLSGELVTAVCAWRWGNSAGPNLAGYPSGYDDAQANAKCDVNLGVGVAVAHKNDVGAQDPGAFQLSGVAAWSAYVIATKSA